MRISDWSSDVCSSDLSVHPLAARLKPLQRGLDLVLPPRCLGCGELVERQGTLCAPCWAAITFVADPLCRRCGLPFAFDPDSDGHGLAGEDYQCGACLAEPPPFERARAVMRYDEASRPLLLGFKHGDRPEPAPPFAPWMARSGVGSLATPDLVAPGPLPCRRLWGGRDNHPALRPATRQRACEGKGGSVREVPGW